MFVALLNTSTATIAVSSTPFIIALIVFVGWELLHGLRRGVKRQALHTVCMLIAAAIAFFATQGFCQTFLDEFDQQTVDEFVLAMEQQGFAAELGLNEQTLDGISEYLADADLLMALPVGTIIVPFLFAIAFVAILLLSKIVYFIIRVVLHLPKGGEESKRIPGAIVGAVEGLLVFALLMVPIAGTVSLVDDGIDAVRAKNDPAYEEFLAEYDATAPSGAAKAIFNAVNKLGGEAMCNKFATVYVDGEEINLRDELIVAVSVGIELSTLDGSDMKNLTEDDKRIINSAVDTIGYSDYLASITSTLLSTMAYIVDNGELPLEIDPPYDSLVNDIIVLFETSDKDNLHKDLTTILDIYYILSDDGVLSAIEGGDGDTITDALITRDENGETVINKVITTLKGNDRTAPLVITLSKLSIAMLADQLHIEGLSPEVYDGVTEQLDTVLSIKEEDYDTPEEYKEALTESIDTALSENGIVLKDEIVSEMADIVDQEKQKNPDMTVDDIILTYYDAYLNHLDDGEIPDGTLDNLPTNP